MPPRAIPPLDRFATLAVRRGISPGALCSSGPADFALVMAAAACAFAPAREYSERDVNVVLRDWLAGAGAMLDVDHVELRRWLVDTHILDRDGYGRVYARGAPDAEIAALIEGLSGADLAAMAHEARRRDVDAREERKRKWTKRLDGASR